MQQCNPIVLEVGAPYAAMWYLNSEHHMQYHTWSKMLCLRLTLNNHNNEMMTFAEVFFAPFHK